MTTPTPSPTSGLGEAFTFSGVVALAYWTAQRSENRGRFMELHEILTNPATQAGRRILYTKVHTRKDVDRLFRRRKNGEFDMVNRAVGLYNTLAVYVYAKYIPRGEAMANWAQAVRSNWEHIEVFLLWRRNQGGDPYLWDYLVWFAELVGADVDETLRLPEGMKPGESAIRAARTSS